jgi:hypothetical protein
MRNLRKIRVPGILKVMCAAVLLYSIAASIAYGDELHPKTLCGRWRSEPDEVSVYWVIDRKPDGKYISKEIWIKNQKEAVALISWGSWSVKKGKVYKTYLQVEEGNTANRPKYQGVSQLYIRDQRPDTNYFFTAEEGAPFVEHRSEDMKPLRQIDLEAPRGKTVKNTIEKPIMPEPDWVRSTEYQE